GYAIQVYTVQLTDGLYALFRVLVLTGLIQDPTTIGIFDLVQAIEYDAQSTKY
ncbi:phage holin, partial [Staphylococcus aureus]